MIHILPSSDYPNRPSPTLTSRQMHEAALVAQLDRYTGTYQVIKSLHSDLPTKPITARQLTHLVEHTLAFLP